ncbi:MAG TPA: hypothetical protein VFW19_13570 [Allosphingosinicella sp.]|nr:hypothetical protein [Allosphingosinicella sp.]
MTAKLMLRIASFISLLFALGHSLGGLNKWSPTGDNPVLKAMTDVPFTIMGVRRTYLDLYLGLGWTLSVFMLLQTILLWQMASLAEADAARVRPMIAAFALATLAGGVLASVLIFPVPALFSAALLIALVLAWFARR